MSWVSLLSNCSANELNMREWRFLLALATLDLLTINTENNAEFQLHFTPAPSNTKIPKLYVRYHVKTISKGLAKVRKFAQFENFVLLFNKNGLMKQFIQR